jgi:hypothetical protein
VQNTPKIFTDIFNGDKRNTTPPQDQLENDFRSDEAPGNNTTTETFKLL